LDLKVWFANDQGLELPEEIKLPLVEAISPYNAQIAQLKQQIGRTFPRQAMKDTSSASIMDAKTQITKLHGISILESARQPLESNLCQALTREHNGVNDNAMINVVIGAEVNLHGDAVLAAADASRAAGNAPNSVLAAGASILGPGRVDAARQAVDKLIDLFAHSGLSDSRDESFDFGKIAMDDAARACFLAARADRKAEAMIKAVEARGAKSLFLKFLRSLGGPVSRDAVLAGIATTIAWGPLTRKRISRETARNLPWYLRLYATLLGVSVDGSRHEAERFCGISNQEILTSWSVTELAYLTLMGERADPERLFAFQVLVGLLISNGPGSISAQGAKGAVSADGPQAPERVQINKAMVGFLAHTGYSHGGAGYEGITFLVEQFRDTRLADPGDPNHSLDLKGMAKRYAQAYGSEKAALKEVGGERRAIPGVNHPVFKDKPVNKDPREVFLDELFNERGEYNVFHEYYKELVRALFEEGVTRNVFCINIDAVIGALLLKMLWPRYRAGKFSEHDLEVAAFTIFLYGRMIGCAAEIDDHINRGRNMDTRTAASALKFVA
jgi:hypothetical protein